MCPMCMTSAALIAASGASGAGVLGFVALKFKAMRRPRHNEEDSKLLWISTSTYVDLSHETHSPIVRTDAESVAKPDGSATQVAPRL
jgi:hypothetical protein